MASFNFLNLTDEIRQNMLNELNSDIQADRLYLSTRLNQSGLELYPEFIREAIETGNDTTLMESLESGSYFNPTYERQGKYVKMPTNSAELLAQGEYNRYYIRGVCLQAIKDDLKSVEIYRARESSWVRPESEMKIGKRLDPRELLDDLRNNIGKEPTILPEVNSGLSVRL